MNDKAHETLANKIADRAADISSGYDPTRFDNHSELIHAITLTAATEILTENIDTVKSPYHACSINKPGVYFSSLTSHAVEGPWGFLIVDDNWSHSDAETEAERYNLAYKHVIESCAALVHSLGCLGPSMCGGGAHHDPRCPQVLNGRLLGLLEGPVDASGGAVADAADAVSAGAPEDLPEVPCALCGQRPVILKTQPYGFICASCAELDQYLNEK